MHIVVPAASCTRNRSPSFGKLAFSAMIRRKASIFSADRAESAARAFALARSSRPPPARPGPACGTASAASFPPWRFLSLGRALRPRLRKGTFPDSAVHVRLSSITKPRCSDEAANQAPSPRNRRLKKFLKKGVAPKIEMSIILSCAKETKRTEEIPR